MPADRYAALRSLAPPPASPVPRALLDDADTLTGVLAAMVARDPTFECLILCAGDGMETRLSLIDLWRRAGVIQTVLAEEGMQPGERVIVILPTGAELLASYVGVLRAGGVPGLIATPSNRIADATVFAEHVGAILRNAQARFVLCDADVSARLRAVPSACAGVTLLHPSQLPIDTPNAAAPVRRDADAIATVQYSSGSTGAPKGVLLTHRAILNNIRALRDGFGLTTADVSVNWLPLYHDMGLIGAFLLPLALGCPTVLIPTMAFMRDPALWLWAIHHYRGTISWAPNFAYTLCATRVAADQLDGLDLRSWRIAVNAAEPVIASTIEQFTARFAAHGLRAEAMTPLWGLAETVLAATRIPVADGPLIERIDRRRLALSGEAVRATAGDDVMASVGVGRCLPESAVQIRDETGRALPDRHVGTIWLRSNSLFSGYHGDAAQTARVLVDGWLDTGDQGYLVGPDLFFVARQKDLVVIGGEKYAPQDLETAINQVPGVRQGCAVVFGILNEARGTEDVCAVVETRESAPEVRAKLIEAIRVAVVDATGIGLRHVLLVPPGGVEKTTSGKLARSATRRRWAAELPSGTS
jgi:acyl-CoA synthetase (AMP-forming)/AMP-acid ligase II